MLHIRYACHNLPNTDNSTASWMICSCNNFSIEVLAGSCDAGVYGRATELAKVTQRKHNLAMAVVMGRDLDSVICDTEATAKECISWLRQNQVAPMTFFPLDAVRAKVSI